MPPGWVEATVGELIDLNPKTEAADATTAGFVPMQALGTGFRSKLSFEPRPWGDIKKAYTHFGNGDVLLAKITPCFENGKAGLVQGLPSGLGAGSSEFFVCRPKPNAIDARYLLAWVSGDDFRRRATLHMTGSVGHKRVPKDFLLSEVLPLAPYEEQQRIVDKLDNVLAHVDTCRDRLSRVALILRRFRQSVLAAATSGRLTDDWRGQGAFDWIKLRAADACAKVQSGGTPKAGFTETTGIPFLKVYNIVNQQIDFEYRPQFVHPEVHAGELGKSRALPGDVVMNIVGPPLGKVAVLTDAAAEWNINQALTLFRPSERVTSGWLYVLLCEGAAVRGVLDRTKGSVGQVNISLSQCRAFEFPVPTIEEQNEIVRRVKALFAFADRLEARLAQAQIAVDRLTPSLLAKAFRGELVPQDPNDAPATELLRRLKPQALSSSPKRTGVSSA